MCYEKLQQKFPLQVSMIFNAQKNHRLGHSFIIASDSLDVRESFAKLLAQTACCVNSNVDGSPCNSCYICDQFNRNIYPDILELYPVGKKRQIRVGTPDNPEPNTMRYFENHLHMTGLQGNIIGIVKDADCLNSQSQNALLKTLEEPPKNVFIILSTANPMSLLPTTRSRCQTIMLLENSYKFNYSDAERLFVALGKLWFSPERGLLCGASVATELTAMTANLESEAMSISKQKWEAQITQAKEFDPTLVKTLEERCNNEAFAGYSKIRAEFLEAINTFASQVYLLSQGVSCKHLPSPEMFEYVQLPAVETIRPEIAEKFQQKTAKLISDLRYNVNEELAFLSYGLELGVFFNTNYQKK